MFDPFGDANTRGYLRNVFGVRDLGVIKQLEQNAFRLSVAPTLEWLANQEDPKYPHLLETHKRLFHSLYPWAGQDRAELFPQKTVRKGETVFANPDNIEQAFNGGQRAATPGQTLGYWAFSHPFLECNGRAIFTFFSDHLRRKNLALQWSMLDSDKFLEALTVQIESPRSPLLDSVLTPALKSIPYSHRVTDVAKYLSDVNWSQTAPEPKTWKHP